MSSRPQACTMMLIIEMISEGKDITPLLSGCPKLMDDPIARSRFVRRFEILNELELDYTKPETKKQQRLSEELTAISDAEFDELIEHTGESKLGVALANSILELRVIFETICVCRVKGITSHSRSQSSFKRLVELHHRYESAVMLLESCCEFMNSQQACGN